MGNEWQSAVKWTVLSCEKFIGKPQGVLSVLDIEFETSNGATGRVKLGNSQILGVLWVSTFTRSLENGENSRCHLN